MLCARNRCNRISTQDPTVSFPSETPNGEMQRHGDLVAAKEGGCPADDLAWARSASTRTT